MQVLLNGLIVGAAYALLGIGFSLLYSTVRYFNLAYGMTVVMGAYVSYALISENGWNFPIGMLVGAIAGSVIAVISYLLIFRPMMRRKSSNLVILVASFGLLTILQNLTALIFGNSTKSLSLTDRIIEGYDFFGLIITPNQIMIGAFSIVLMLLLELVLNKTKIGMAIRAIGDNEELTKILGLKTDQIILTVFVITAFLGSLSATLMALEIGLRPTHGVYLVIKAIIAAIIGGLGSIRGALLGALLLGVAENIGIFYFGAEWQDTVAFVLLGIFLLIRPEGLFAKKSFTSL